MKTMDSIINTPVSIKIKPVKIVINLLITLVVFSLITFVEFLIFSSPYYLNSFLYTEKMSGKLSGIFTKFRFDDFFITASSFLILGIITIIVSCILCRFVKLSDAELKKFTKRNTLFWTLALIIYSVFKMFFYPLLGSFLSPVIMDFTSSIRRFKGHEFFEVALYSAAYFTVFCFLLYNVIFRLYHYRKNRLATK